MDSDWDSCVTKQSGTYLSIQYNIFMDLSVIGELQGFFFFVYFIIYICILMQKYYKVYTVVVTQS